MSCNFLTGWNSENRIVQLPLKSCTVELCQAHFPLEFSLRRMPAAELALQPPEVWNALVTCASVKKAPSRPEAAALQLLLKVSPRGWRPRGRGSCTP